MFTTLFLTTSIDGYIAHLDDTTPWGEETVRSYFDFCNTFGNVILGRRTFELMLNDAANSALRVKQKVVVSKTEKAAHDHNTRIVPTPAAALSLLSQAGFTKALLIGGRSLASSFFRENLIDNVVIDLNPVFIGKGISILDGTVSEKKLQLINHHLLAPSVLRLHYKVVPTTPRE